MRTPALFRTTPFRLTLLFLALFAAGAGAFLVYIYLATAGEVNRRARAEVDRETRVLMRAYERGGVDALNKTIIERALADPLYVGMLMRPDGIKISGTLDATPVRPAASEDDWEEFVVDGRATVGRQSRLVTGELVFVGADIADQQGYVMRVVRASWGAGALVLLIGLAGGLLISRRASRYMAGLTNAVAAVRAGDLRARAPLRGTHDEYDELAAGMNDMLDRIERLMGGLRHAGDAIAHDLRSPLTRLRTRMEVALLEVEAGRGDAQAALEQALSDADNLLKTFNAVLAISRLQAAGQAPDPVVFDSAELAEGVSELYEPLCEEKGVDYQVELTPDLPVRANREFMAQALANLIDNAVKYTPPGGAVMVRTRRTSTGEVEFSVTDTGPGVPEADRGRIAQRFVRLENSRTEPGVGLGLSLVAAVAEAHGGRLEVTEGPGRFGGFGPGLRVALLLPGAV
ncbi:MAG: HAMP domain-containing histidine kinase [Pseudomonadota bacterium]|nr:HAMP domain-containing histidine kinase [Pseudomonadota bacterium]